MSTKIYSSQRFFHITILCFIYYFILLPFTTGSGPSSAMNLDFWIHIFVHLQIH
uniref:Predicted protein n=1 Tax=Hordeum vulgare subsp. vulgare TaxID=112509 RepID=F2DLV3_HORVV|nr:predicted protein [Hordeum vulgare subsp. vulgare]